MLISLLGPNGSVAIIDDEDYPVISGFKWREYSGRAMYKGRMQKNGERPFVHMSRLIMGNPEGMVVDHINGNPLDNRKENLRVCSLSQNNKNIIKRKPSDTGFKGVARAGKKFVAQIMNNRKIHYLGKFNSPEEAAVAYDNASKELHREFGSQNFSGGA